MKKILIWLLIFAAVVMLVYLVNAGKIRWQPLTVAVAALMAPLKFISGLFGDDEDKIRERHRRVRERETQYQVDVEAEVQRRTRRVEALQTEVNRVDAEVDQLRQERSELEEDIAGQSAGQLADRFRNAMG